MTDMLFDINGKTIAVTGGAGVLCGAMCKSLAQRGAKVGVLDFNIDGAKALVDEIKADGGEALAIKCNVLELDSIKAAYESMTEAWGHVDVLVNGAGGNKKEATCVPPETTFFGLDADAIRWVFDLNCLGTMMPSQVFGAHMAERGEGTIINISSMNAFRPLTRIAAYSAAKAAISNFTQWLAVHLAQEYSPNIRVNAIAPGFFLTEQNRFLLQQENGDWTARGQQILDHTPQARFGKPEDLTDTLLWLLSPGSAFVHGIVVPVDGGFSAFSGV
jgi:NAD(P)-dependent dehydrogenase (short-subunit alcohol dehydrogenase family)